MKLAMLVLTLPFSAEAIHPHPLLQHRSGGIGPLTTAKAYVPPLAQPGAAPRPGTPNVTLHWFDQQIDHFSWRSAPNGSRTYRQRYFVNTQYWKADGPIFFYCGNEANVELYVNATGLMWENAEEHGAALVFAEHRYYGESQMPFYKPGAPLAEQELSYLTMEQALADYASLIAAWKRRNAAQRSAVVAFGGSYGGMLAAWLRMKYPSAVDGAIAASAPILAFAPNPGAVTPAPFGDGESFWRVVTDDAGAKGGASPSCAANVRAAWPALFKLGETAAGRAALQRTFRLCDSTPVASAADAMRLALFVLNAFDTMSMGNFPYPSNYLIFQQTRDPTLLLPAFPVRAACEHLRAEPATFEPSAADPTQLRLLAALRDAAAVFYNASRAQCFELPDDPNFDGIWDYQYCTELLPQETYFARDGVHDMFWPSGFNMTAIRVHCEKTLGVAPRPEWIGIEFGGADMQYVSNTVFTNGAYDPWSAGGVVRNVSDTAITVMIEQGAHHLDLMFSDARDPESVKAARATQMAHIAKWVAGKREALAPRQQEL